MKVFPCLGAKDQGGLARHVKENVPANLIRLHSLGVLHGDVAFRNIVYRESAQQVLFLILNKVHGLTEENLTKPKRG
jgi:tRNA A-37 threonylcarbamoyl transferase component Bud32